MSLALVDSGPLIAYYNQGDEWHETIKLQVEASTWQFVTTSSCVTEVMWALSSDVRVQNEFLADLSIGLYRVESLILKDYVRIAELNLKYSDMPSDFADLTIVAIAERLDIKAILSLDGDFNIYRRFGTKPFDRTSFILKKKSSGKKSH